MILYKQFRSMPLNLGLDSMASTSKKKQLRQRRPLKGNIVLLWRVAMLWMLDDVLVNVLNLQNKNVPWDFVFFLVAQFTGIYKPTAVWITNIIQS